MINRTLLFDSIDLNFLPYAIFFSILIKIGNLITLFSALFATAHASMYSTINAGLAGVSLSFSIGVSKKALFISFIKLKKGKINLGKYTFFKDFNCPK